MRQATLATQSQAGIFLDHLGFLGAQPPAIKGMEAFSFSEPAALDFSESRESSLLDHYLSTIKQFQSVCPNLEAYEIVRMLRL
jgi:hypothetical protein